MASGGMGTLGIGMIMQGIVLIIGRVVAHVSGKLLIILTISEFAVGTLLLLAFFLQFLITRTLPNG